jgi:hypothetical protein
MFFFRNNAPKPRSIYAINSGKYIGEFFVYMGLTEDKLEYNFLSLPKLIKRSVPVKSFKVGLKQKVLVLIESLPEDIFKECRQQFEQTLKKTPSKIAGA